MRLQRYGGNYISTGVGLFAIAVLFVLVGIKPSRATQAYAQPTILQPMTSFDIPANGACTVKDFVPNEFGLFFLAGTPEYAEVVHTSHAGALQKVMVLPSANRAFTSINVRVDPSGNVAVRQSSRQGSRLFFFDPFGALMTQVLLKQPILDIAFARNVLVGFDLKHFALLAEPGETPLFRLPNDISLASVLVGLPSGRVAMLDGDIPRMHIIDLEAGSRQVRLLAAPEIPSRQEVRKLPSNTFELLLFSPVSDANDGLICAASRYSSKTGAIILRFDHEGNLTGRYRCLFPAIAGSTAVDNVASAIGLVGKTLFIVSSRARKCTLYDLED
jgi:hypothetical protein